MLAVKIVFCNLEPDAEHQMTLEFSGDSEEIAKLEGFLDGYAYTKDASGTSIKIFPKKASDVNIKQSEHILKDLVAKARVRFGAKIAEETLFADEVQPPADAKMAAVPVVMGVPVSRSHRRERTKTSRRGDSKVQFDLAPRETLVPPTIRTMPEIIAEFKQRFATYDSVYISVESGKLEIRINYSNNATEDDLKHDIKYIMAAINNNLFCGSFDPDAARVIELSPGRGYVTNTFTLVLVAAAPTNAQILAAIPDDIAGSLRPKLREKPQLRDARLSVAVRYSQSIGRPMENVRIVFSGTEADIRALEERLRSSPATARFVPEIKFGARRGYGIFSFRAASTLTIIPPATTCENKSKISKFFTDLVQAANIGHLFDVDRLRFKKSSKTSLGSVIAATTDVVAAVPSTMEAQPEEVPGVVAERLGRPPEPQRVLHRPERLQTQLRDGGRDGDGSPRSPLSPQSPGSAGSVESPSTPPSPRPPRVSDF